MLDKCTGAAQYAVDVQLPGMLCATVRMNPHLGGAMRSFDANVAEQMPGVRKILPLDGGIAVIASNTWYAMQAAKAVSVEWDEAPYPADTNGHFAALAAAFDDGEDSQLRDDGDVDEALENANVIEGEYRAPYLAHATMEPMNAVAVLRNDKLEIWAGNQNPTQVRKAAAKAADVDADNVTVHTMMMGGGFGRRSEMDFVSLAATIAAQMPGIPIKTTWSREEDMQHDTYRPPAIARFKAAMADGTATALDLKLASPSVTSSAMKRWGIPVGGPDVAIVQAAWDQPYAIPNYRVTGYRAEELLPISFWRSVGASQNGFFHESAIDEIAAAAGASANTAEA